MSDVLDLETRRSIYELITSNPGINLSLIAEKLGISFQLVDYHLLYLQHHDLIVISKEKGFKRCFIKESIGQQDKRVHSLLLQDVPRRIVLFLLQHPHARHKEMLQHFNMSSPQFSYHLRKLVKNNIIEQETKKDAIGYVVSNEQEIVTCLIKYQPREISQMVKEFWKDFKP